MASRSRIVGLLALAALPLVACSGGGLSGPEKTGTAENVRYAATATAAAEAEPMPAAADIAGVIRHGFDGLDIPYGATSVDSFSDVDALLGVLQDCDRDNAGGVAKSDPAFWPAVLGHCYTVGDAAKWLYGYTGRRDFAYANQMMMRFMRAKIDEANAAGASLADGYWQLVLDKIYTLAPAGTPVPVTPPAQ